MSETEFLGVALLLIAGAVAYALGTRDKLADTHKGETVFTHALPLRQYQLRGSCSVELIRQSGATYRHLGTFVTFEAALAETIRSFNRAKINEVRITHEDATALAIYRRVYSLSGRAQGQKMAGAIFRAEKVDLDSLRQADVKPSQNLEKLSLSVASVEGEGTQKTVLFDYHCKNCGTTNEIGTDEEDATEDCEVKCRSCGIVFATFGDFKVFCQREAQSRIGRSP